MSTRWRMFGVLATTALVVTACSTGTGSHERPVGRSPVHGRIGRRPLGGRAVGGQCRPGRVRLVAHHDSEPRQGRLPGHRRRLHGGAPEREDQHHGPWRTRRSRPSSPPTMQAGDVPDLFQSWGGGRWPQQADAGLLKDITADVASWTGHDQPGRHEHLPVQRQAVRHPVGHGHGRLLVQQGRSSSRPASRPRPTTWDEYLAAVEKLKDAGITPLAIAGKDKWPSMHLWTYLVLRIGGGDALAQMVQSGDWNTDACIKAGEDVVALNALNPYQDGFQGATYNRRGGRGRQRQGGHGADGPVGARGPEGQQRRQEGPRRRPRLVRLPDRRRRRRRTPPTASAAATASRSARTRRPRRSTS